MFTTKILNRTVLAAVGAAALVGVAVAQEAHKHEAAGYRNETRS